MTIQPAHSTKLVEGYYFERLSEDAVRCDLRGRTHDVVEFVCAKLKLPRLPEVVWIRPVARHTATEILKCWKQTYENGIVPVGSRPPIRRFEKDIKEGFTPSEPPNEIWIRSDLSDFPNLELIAAHETRHVWQTKPENGAEFDCACTAEGDAYPYGYAVLKEYLTATRQLTPQIAARINEKRESARSVFLREWPEAASKWLNFEVDS